MLREKVEKEFLKLNPDAEKEKLSWKAGDILEWRCGHGKGHPVYAVREKDYAHDCDGCCEKIKPVDLRSVEDEVAEEYGRVC